jgi:hypothetical protein
MKTGLQQSNRLPMTMTNHESASIAAPAILLALFLAVAAPAETLRLESSALRV